MRVLVLGASSFSGKDFVQLLTSNPKNTVYGIGRKAVSDWRPNYAYSRVDIRDSDRLISHLEEWQPEYIVNFAALSEVAPSWEHAADYYHTNVCALADMLQYLSGVNWLKKYLHVSSPEAYGSCDGVDESSPDRPSTPYAASKSAAEQLVRVFDLPWASVRATNVYGPGQQAWKLIPKAIIQLKKGERVKLNGGGSSIKSYINIRDVSRGELEVLRHGVGRYHLYPDKTETVAGIVRIICKQLGKDFDEWTYEGPPRKGVDRIYRLSTCRELNWHPSIQLYQGIRSVIDWVDANWETLKDAPLEYVYES